MDLRDIKYHSCPLDDENGLLLIDMETESLPEMDEDGNYLYYCNSGHTFCVDEDESSYYPSWRRTSNTQETEEGNDCHTRYSEATTLMKDAPPILNKLGLGTTALFDGLSTKDIGQALHRPEVPVRIAAAQTLEETEEPQNVSCSKLGAVAQYDAVSEVRSAAIRALGRLHRSDQTTMLIESLHDKAWVVRAAAIEALGQLGKLAPLNILVQSAKGDSQADVRATAIVALSNLDEEVPLDVITSALYDRDWQVREMAALVLGKLMREVAIPYLEEALNDPEILVQNAAEQSLWKLRKK